MRKWTSLLILIVIVSGIGTAQGQQGTRPVPVHLVVGMSQGGEASLNRMDWDVNAFVPLEVGTNVRANDYIEVSGDTSLAILCTDLELIEQRGSEVPRCNAYPEQTAFLYTDMPTWMPDVARTVNVLPPDLVTIPVEVTEPDSFTLDEISGGTLDTVLATRNTILDLDISTQAKAFALSSYYRTEGLLFDAIGVLIPDLECSARRPFVEPPNGNTRDLFKSAPVYLRMGELFQMIGQDEDAARYYTCAADLAQGMNDSALQGLSFTRLAGVTQDAGQKIEFYQMALDNYAVLNTPDVSNVVLDLCGRGNCTQP